MKQHIKKKFLKPSGVAVLLGLSRQKVIHLIRTRHLDAVRLPGCTHWLIPVTSVEEYINSAVPVLDHSVNTPDFE